MLRKLRDLDLRTGWVAITRSRSVRVDGCLSLDVPVEEGLLYRLFLRDGSAEASAGILQVGCSDGGLDLAIESPGSDGCARHFALVPAADGRALAPGCLARLDPESADRREVERFLRRLVRGVFAAQGKK